MMRITKHGKFNEFESTECPECGCCFEYTQEYIGRNNGYLKCPECLHTIIGIVSDDKGHDDTYLKLITSYKRDFTKEYEAIEKCIESIDFKALAKSYKFLAENIDDFEYLADKTENSLRQTAKQDFEYLADKTENSLRQTAKQELIRAFEQMEKHGYTINYRDNGIAISYCVEGVFNVDTFYDPVEEKYWCTCNYALFNGTSF